MVTFNQSPIDREHHRGGLDQKQKIKGCKALEINTQSLNAERWTFTCLPANHIWFCLIQMWYDYDLESLAKMTFVDTCRRAIFVVFFLFLFVGEH